MNLQKGPDRCCTLGGEKCSPLNKERDPTLWWRLASPIREVDFLLNGKLHLR